MDNQGFANDVEHRHSRVQRAERILENHLNLAAKGHQSLALEGQEIDGRPSVVEDDLTLVRRYRAHDEFADRRLAAAAFADQAETFAAMNIETDIVDGGHGHLGSLGEETAFPRGEPFDEALDSQQGSRVVRALRPWFARRHQRSRLVLDLAQGHQAVARFHIEMGDRLHQPLEVRVFRRVKNIVHGAAFHDSPVIHDDDLLGDIGNDAEIMRDHQHRHAEFVLERAHQFQNLRLYRNVERGRRFVGDKEGRTADQGHGDHRPLAQPTGEFEGI